MFTFAGKTAMKSEMSPQAAHGRVPDGRSPEASENLEDTADEHQCPWRREPARDDSDVPSGRHEMHDPCYNHQNS